MSDVQNSETPVPQVASEKRRSIWGDPVRKVASEQKPVDAWLQPAKDALLPAGDLRAVQDALVLTAQNMAGDADQQDLMVRHVQALRDMQARLALDYQRFALQHTDASSTIQGDSRAFYDEYMSSHNLPPSLNLSTATLPATVPNGPPRAVRLNQAAATALLRQVGVLNAQEPLSAAIQREQQKRGGQAVPGKGELIVSMPNGLRWEVGVTNPSANRSGTEPVEVKMAFDLATKDNSKPAEALFNAAQATNEKPKTV